MGHQNIRVDVTPVGDTPEPEWYMPAEKVVSVELPKGVNVVLYIDVGGIRGDDPVGLS